MNHNSFISLGFKSQTNSLLIRFAHVFIWAISLGFAAWISTILIWRVATPNRPALPFLTSHDPMVAVDSIINRSPGDFFGDTEKRNSDSLSSTEYIPNALVTGVAGHPGWAIFTISGGAQIGVIEGEEVKPGLRLEKVYADRVVLTSNSGSETLSFNDKSTAANKSNPISASEKQ